MNQNSTTPFPTGLLALLAFANFTIGMGAFVVIGILSPVAQAFGVDKAHAGWLMTVYAIVYAIGSPLLVASTGRFDRKTMLVAGLAVFGAGAGIAISATQFETLLIGRSVMALGGGIVTPVAAALGVALAGLAAQGRALSVVFGGLTLAQVLGVPAGAWLGYSFGWQTAFIVVVLLSLFSVLAVVAALPKSIAVPRASLSLLWGVLTSFRLMTAISFTAWFIGGLYVVYTYMAPLLETRYGMGRDGVTTVLLVFGAGAVIGNSMGGFLTDRIGPLRTLTALGLAQCVLLPLVTAITWPTLALGGLVGVWSICGWSFMVPQQARLAQMSAKQVPIVFALNASAIYVGASLGSAVGGKVLGAMGLGALGTIGAILAAVAIASLALVSRLSIATSRKT
jgi:predicted MFS family arabinose efflux permease